MKTLVGFYYWIQEQPLSSVAGIFATMLVLCFGDVYPIIQANGDLRGTYPWLNQYGDDFGWGILICMGTFWLFMWIAEKLLKRSRRPKKRSVIAFIRRWIITPEVICGTAALITIVGFPWTTLAIVALYVLLCRPFGKGLVSEGVASVLRPLLVVGAIVLAIVDVTFLWHAEALKHPDLDWDTRAHFIIFEEPPVLFAWVWFGLKNEIYSGV